jgi:hypothetical protein
MYYMYTAVVRGWLGHEAEYGRGDSSLRNSAPLNLIQVVTHSEGPSVGTYGAGTMLGWPGGTYNAHAILKITFVLVFASIIVFVFGKYCIRQSKIDIRTCYSLVLDRNSFDSSESSKFDL